MKPQYQVRNQAGEVHGGSKAVFGTVKIHIHIDARQSVWATVFYVLQYFSGRKGLCVFIR